MLWLETYPCKSNLLLKYSILFKLFGEKLYILYLLFVMLTFKKVFKKEFPLIAKNVEVSFLENKDTFNDVEWKNLYKLSEDTFVEERDSLKQGAAGAGLTDNDWW